MTIVPRHYIEILKNRDFSMLCLVTIIGQFASAFLLLSLIISVYEKTGSNFGISGVVLSSVTPGFFLMGFAGLLADLFDRKKIIIASNVLIAVIVFLVLLSSGNIFTSISLSFLYFGVNSFFMSAANAASSQLVREKDLLAANSVFVFCIAGGQVFGLMLAAFVHFFLGNLATILICEILLCIAAIVSFLLPKMSPRVKKTNSALSEIVAIWKATAYTFGRKKTWLFFVMLAFSQSIIAFGVTLGPGFFEYLFKMPIEKSLIIIFPLVSLGALIGAVFVRNPKIGEGNFLSVGLLAIGLPGFLLGVLIVLGLNIPEFLIFPVILYLVLLGFGVIISIIASRTVLQRLVPHNYLGSVLGANTILTSFFAGFLSPFGAGFVALFGYVWVLVLGGLMFSFGAFVLLFASNKWKF